jgi:hypothetical protein
MLAMDLGNYRDTYNHFPAATIINLALAPDLRLSWRADLALFFWQCPPEFNRAQTWNSPENYPPTSSPGIGMRNMPRIPDGHVRTLNCPANPNSGDEEVVSNTHYVGAAGVGVDIEYLPKDYPLAGIFGYDRQITLDDIKNGASRTLLVIETATANGPWTRGGPSTVRALDQDRLPYLGPKGQFSSLHWPHVTHAVFADGSVRALEEGIEPRVFEGMASIAVDEEYSCVY